MGGEFYVYRHIRNDNGEVFYIGKGCAERAYTKRGRTAVWRQICEVSGGFTVSFIAQNLSEADAFALEAATIAKLGDTIANVRPYGGPADPGKQQARRIRKVVTFTADPDLVDWLKEWRKSQTAEVPLGRAFDAAILAFRASQGG